MRTILLIAFLNLLFTTTNAKTWETISHGFYDNPTVWMGDEVPEITTNDTILIKHPLVLTHDLIFDNGTDITIESEGGICGHQKMSMLSDTKLVSYGILELDSLYINGGDMDFLDGHVILSTWAMLEGPEPSSFTISGAAGAVGLWFECLSPYYDFVTVDTEEVSVPEPIKVYPTQVNEFITIEFHKTIPDTEISLIDFNGRILSRQHFNNQQKLNVDLRPWPTGWYIVGIRNENGIEHHKVFKY